MNSYQDLHIDGTYQKYLLISDYIKKYYKEAKNILDIGCNKGTLLEYFKLDSGLMLKTYGIEQKSEYIKENIRIMQINENNINFIKKHDIVLLLSVFHQLNNNEELAIKLLKKIRKKSKEIFFFQNPSIKSKFKWKVNFKDNDKKSIIDYNLKFLSEIFPNDKIEYIGKSELNNKNEKYRYIFAVMK